MDQNDKKNTPNRPGGGKNSNVRSIISLVSWALLLTILISYASTYMSSAGNQSSSITVEYSEFKDMVAEGQVAQVEFDTSENILHITPADGYTYTNEDGVSYTKSTDEKGAIYTYTDQTGREQTVRLDLFTVQLESDDAVIAYLDANNVTEYGMDYQPPVSCSGLLCPALRLLPAHDLPGHALDNEKGRHGRNRWNRRRGQGQR